MTKPIFVVVNALSKEGGSIINTLLAEGKYQIRGTITEPIDSTPPAMELKKRGVELYQIDFTKKSDFNKVLHGSTAAFLMTPVISYSDPDYCQKVIDYLKLQADAALEEKIEHVILSSVDTPVLTDEQRSEYKFDILSCRTTAQRYIESLSIKYVSTFNLAFSYSHLLEFIPITRDEDTAATIGLPVNNDVRLPFVDPYTATGPIVSEFLKQPCIYNRAIIPIVSQWLNGKEIEDKLCHGLGALTRYYPYDRDQYFSAFNFYATTESELIGNRIFEMWESTAKYGYFYKLRNIHFSSEINPKALTLGQFLKSTKWHGDSLVVYEYD